MKKQKIAGTPDKFLVSDNNYEDDDCPVCRLMQRVEGEGREPTVEEVNIAMKEAQQSNTSCL
jgi:hypothetical protein